MPAFLLLPGLVTFAISVHLSWFGKRGPVTGKQHRMVYTVNSHNVPGLDCFSPFGMPLSHQYKRRRRGGRRNSERGVSNMNIDEGAGSGPGKFGYSKVLKTQ